MLRPLIFRNSFRNIQNIKNVLRIKCYAPHPSKASLCPPSPRGEGLTKGSHSKSLTFCNNPLQNGRCPPPGGKPMSKAVNIISNVLQLSVTKKVLPLIRPKLCFVHLPPRGKAISKAVIKISNGLQQSVTRRAMPAPEGKAISKAKINFWTIMLQSVTKRAMPAPEGEGYIKGED